MVCGGLGVSVRHRMVFWRDRMWFWVARRDGADSEGMGLKLGSFLHFSMLSGQDGGGLG